MKKRLFKKKTDLKRVKSETGVFKFTERLKKITKRINQGSSSLLSSLKKDLKTGLNEKK